MMFMYITRGPNRGSPPAVLLRESYREGGRVKTRTLANLSAWPGAKVEALRRVLKGATVVAPGRALDDRARPAARPRRRRAGGGAPARPGQARAAPAGAPGQARSGADRGPHRRAGGQAGHRAPIERRHGGALAGRGAGARGRRRGRALCRARSLGAAQPKIEAALARRHLKDGTLVLYDVTSSYWRAAAASSRRSATAATAGATAADRVRPVVRGRRLPGGGRGVRRRHRRPDDARRADRQAQERFGLEAGGAGRRPRPDHQRAHRGGAQARRARLDHGAARAGHPGAAATAGRCSSPSSTARPGRDPLARFPGERLVVCRNPMLAAERARKREELLAATEKELARIRRATARAPRPLRGAPRSPSRSAPCSTAARSPSISG